MKSAELLPSVVHYLLYANASITAIVGDKIRIGKADQTDLPPYIIFRKTNGSFPKSKDGNSSLAMAMVEVELYAETYAQLATIATLVRQTLDGQAGTIDGHDIKLLTYETTRDTYQDAAALDGIHMLQQDYLIYANTN